MSRVDEGYVKPGDSWEAGDIRTDLADATGRIGREKYFNAADSLSANPFCYE